MARVSSILQSNRTMDTKSKPTFVILGNPFLSDIMLVWPFVGLTCLFALAWLSLSMCLFVCFLYLLAIFFACLLACSLFVACKRLVQGCLE